VVPLIVLGLFHETLCAQIDVTGETLKPVSPDFFDRATAFFAKDFGMNFPKGAIVHYL